VKRPASDFASTPRHCAHPSTSITRCGGKDHPQSRLKRVQVIVDTPEGIGREVAAVADNLATALEKASSVADVLANRGTPFVIATGHGASGMPKRLQDIPTLSKPFLRRDLERAMRAALAR
jgi:hypothetical protein